MIEDVYHLLLGAIAARRLIVFTGAGISMTAPSNVPSARALAEECARRNAEQTGEEFDSFVRGNIEAQAQIFLSRGRLENYFLSKLLPREQFTGEPNKGHLAIADFLLCNAVDLSVTANVDVLVEHAAAILGDATFFAAVDGNEAAAPQSHQALLKIHGCILRGPLQTLWCKEQLSQTLWQQRLQTSVQWLTGRLTQRDIVIIGFWTDWGYLNGVLSQYLGGDTPLSLTLVDPSTSEDLAAKAPDLWDWSQRSDIVFHHVQLSGDEFLDELRRRYSHLLLRRIAATGARAFSETLGITCPAFPDLSGCTTDDLYDLRRDWSGCRRNAVVRHREAHPSDELLGRTFYDCVNAGGVVDGSFITISGNRIRLLQGAGRMLYSMKAEFNGDMGPVGAPDFTVCVGAFDDGGATPSLVRGMPEPSVIRPGLSGEWCTNIDANNLPTKD